MLVAAAEAAEGVPSAAPPVGAAASQATESAGRSARRGRKRTVKALTFSNSGDLKYVA